MAQARRAACALAAALVISCFAAAAGLAAADPEQAGWDADTYPNPKRDLTLCGRRGRPSNLCDPDGLLPVAAASRVEGVIQDVGAAAPPYAAAPCAGTAGAPRGYAVAVALMRKLHVREGEAPAAAARRVAAALHAAWGVGSGACDDGVLILLAADQRQVYISTGAGAAAALGDAAAGEVIAAMRPLLRQSPPDYAGAVAQAVTDVGLGLAGRARSGESEWEWFPVLFFGGVLGMLGWSATGAWRRRREYRRCRDAVRRLAEEQARMRRREWSRPRTCAVCLEELAGGGAGAAGEDESPSAPLLAHESGPLEEAEAAAGGDADSAGPSTSALKAPPPAEAEAPEGLRRRRAAVAAAAEAASASAAGAAAPAAERTPVTLHCGHTFCRPCLDAWAERASTCPVCRARLDDGAPADAPRGAPPPAGSGLAPRRRRGALDAAALDADLAFRLAMLRLRYPGYISADVADGWAAAGAAGAFDWERARAFQLQDPGVAARQTAAGYGGNATPFGGGGGGGGGGAGGSW